MTSEEEEAWVLKTGDVIVLASECVESATVALSAQSFGVDHCFLSTIRKDGLWDASQSTFVVEQSVTLKELEEADNNGDNEEVALSKGKSVLFGNAVLIRHVESQKYLSSSSTLSLSRSLALSSWWQLLPSSGQSQVGEKISVHNNQLSLVSVLNDTFIRARRDEGDSEQLLRVEASFLASSWLLWPFSTASLNNALKGGSVVRMKSNSSNLIVAMDNNEEHELIVDYDKEINGISALWRIEIGCGEENASQFWLGGTVQWNQTVHLVHLASGLLLSVDHDNRLCLMPRGQSSSVTASFALCPTSNSAIDSDIVLEESVLLLQHSHSSLFLCKENDSLVLKSDVDEKQHGLVLGVVDVDDAHDAVVVRRTNSALINFSLCLSSSLSSSLSSEVSRFSASLQWLLSFFCQSGQEVRCRRQMHMLETDILNKLADLIDNLENLGHNKPVNEQWTLVYSMCFRLIDVLMKDNANSASSFATRPRLMWLLSKLGHGSVRMYVMSVLNALVTSSSCIVAMFDDDECLDKLIDDLETNNRDYRTLGILREACKDSDANAMRGCQNRIGLRLLKNAERSGAKYNELKENNQHLLLSSHLVPVVHNVAATVMLCRGPAIYTKWYLEIAIERAEGTLMRVGWADHNKGFPSSWCIDGGSMCSVAVGDHASSWGFDGVALINHGNAYRSVMNRKLIKGDVVGLSLDLEAGELRYYLNGIDVGAHFEMIDTCDCCLYPLVSLTQGSKVRFLLDSSSFCFSPPSSFLPLAQSALLTSPSLTTSLEFGGYNQLLGQGQLRLHGPSRFPHNALVLRPTPVDTSKVELPPSLELDLPRIAQRVHEHWLREKITEGWVYGPEKDDLALTHPLLVAFEALDEQEQLFKRQFVCEILKVVMALGPVIEHADEEGVSQARVNRQLSRLQSLLLRLGEQIHLWWSCERMDDGLKLALAESEFLSPFLVPFDMVDDEIRDANCKEASLVLEAMLNLGYNFNDDNDEHKSSSNNQDMSDHVVYRMDSAFGVERGKWYYEVELACNGSSSSSIEIGWMTLQKDNLLSSNNELVFKLNFSSSSSSSVVIGALLDLDSGSLSFTSNGQCILEQSFLNHNNSKSNTKQFRYVPALKMGRGQKCVLNLGQDPRSLKCFASLGLEQDYKPFCYNVIEEPIIRHTQHQPIFVDLNKKNSHNHDDFDKEEDNRFVISNIKTNNGHRLTRIRWNPLNKSSSGNMKKSQIFRLTTPIEVFRRENSCPIKFSLVLPPNFDVSRLHFGLAASSFAANAFSPDQGKNESVVCLNINHIGQGKTFLQSDHYLISAKALITSSSTSKKKVTCQLDPHQGLIMFRAGDKEQRQSIPCNDANMRELTLFPIVIVDLDDQSEGHVDVEIDAEGVRIQRQIELSWRRLDTRLDDLIYISDLIADFDDVEENEHFVLSVPDEHRVVHLADLNEHPELLKFEVETLSLLASLCYRNNSLQQELVSEFCQLSHFIYCLKTWSTMEPRLWQAWIRTLIQVHLDANPNSRDESSKLYILPSMEYEEKEETEENDDVDMDVSMSFLSLDLCSSPSSSLCASSLSSLALAILERLVDIRPSCQRGPLVDAKDVYLETCLELLNALLSSSSLSTAQMLSLLRILQTSSLLTSDSGLRVKLQLCHLMHAFCDTDLRHELESLVTQSARLVARMQLEQRQRYKENLVRKGNKDNFGNHGDKEHHVQIAAQRTKEFRCPPQEQVDILLRQYSSMPLSRESSEKGLRKQMTSTLIQWSNSCSSPILVSSLFSLLLRKFDHQAELTRALKRTYIVDQSSMNDVKALWKSVVIIRSLRGVLQTTKEEELSFRQSLWVIVNNHIFYQHPELIRRLDVHQDALNVMLTAIDELEDDSNDEDYNEATETVVACCRFLCYFCRSSSSNQMELFTEHLELVLAKASILLSRPSLRGCTPLDVANACIVDNMELALALREGHISAIIQALIRCGNESNQELLQRGYPDLGWDPVGGERFLDFLRFCVFVGGETAEDNAWAVLNELMRNLSDLGQILSHGAVSHVFDAVNLGHAISMQLFEAKKEENNENCLININDGTLRHPLNDVDWVDTGKSLLNFYSALVDLLAKCASLPIESRSKRGWKSVNILRSLLKIDEIRRIIGIQSVDADFGITPDHKQSFVSFLARVCVIESREEFLDIIEKCFSQDIRQAALAEASLRQFHGLSIDRSLSLSLNRYICGFVLPWLTSNAHHFSSNLSTTTLSKIMSQSFMSSTKLVSNLLCSVYRLSQLRSLTQVQRATTTDLLLVLAQHCHYRDMDALIRLLLSDIGEDIKPTIVVALKAITRFHEMNKDCSNGDHNGFEVLQHRLLSRDLFFTLLHVIQSNCLVLEEAFVETCFNLLRAIVLAMPQNFAWAAEEELSINSERNMRLRERLDVFATLNSDHSKRSNNDGSANEGLNKTEKLNLVTRMLEELSYLGWTLVPEADTDLRPKTNSLSLEEQYLSEQLMERLCISPLPFCMQTSEERAQSSLNKALISLMLYARNEQKLAFKRALSADRRSLFMSESFLNFMHLWVDANLALFEEQRSATMPSQSFSTEKKLIGHDFELAVSFCSHLLFPLVDVFALKYSKGFGNSDLTLFCKLYQLLIVFCSSADTDCNSALVRNAANAMQKLVVNNADDDENDEHNNKPRQDLLFGFLAKASDDLNWAVLNLKKVVKTTTCSVSITLKGKESELRGRELSACSLPFLLEVSLPLLDSLFANISLDEFCDELEEVFGLVFASLFFVATKSTRLMPDSVFVQSCLHLKGAKIGLCLQKMARILPINLFEEPKDKVDHFKDCMSEQLPGWSHLLFYLEALSSVDRLDTDLAVLVEIVLPLLATFISNSSPDMLSSTYSSRLQKVCCRLMLSALSSRMDCSHILVLALSLRRLVASQRPTTETVVAVNSMLQLVADSAEVITAKEGKNEVNHIKSLVMDLQAVLPLVAQLLLHDEQSRLRDAYYTLINNCTRLLRVLLKSKHMWREERNFAIYHDLFAQDLMDYHLDFMSNSNLINSSIKKFKGDEMERKAVNVLLNSKQDCQRGDVNLLKRKQREMNQHLQSFESIVVLTTQRLLNSISKVMLSGDERFGVAMCINKLRKSKVENFDKEICFDNNEDEAEMWRRDVYCDVALFAENNINNEASQPREERMRLVVETTLLLDKASSLRSLPTSSTSSWRLSLQRKAAVIACFRQTSFFALSPHIALNMFIKAYQRLREQNDEKDDNIIAIVDSLTERDGVGIDLLSHLLLFFADVKNNNNGGREQYTKFASILARSCGDDDEEEEEQVKPSLEEQERCKVQLLQNQSRLLTRGVNKVIIKHIIEASGEKSEMLEATLKLGIAVLRGGNLEAQQAMLALLRENCDDSYKFFNSICSLLAASLVLDLDLFERNTKAEKIVVGVEAACGQKNLEDADTTILLFRFIQLTSEGHNREWQEYLRCQESSGLQSVRSSLNVIDFCVDYLVRLVDSMLDFYWAHLNNRQVEEEGKEAFLTAIEIASQVLNTLTELIQGPCVNNQDALANSRLWDATKGLLFLFARLQPKLSVNSDHRPLLKDLLSLQKDLVVLLLSMLEGNVVDGMKGRRMVDMLQESSTEIKAILSYLELFLRLPTEQDLELEDNGLVSDQTLRSHLERQRQHSLKDIDFVLVCSLQFGLDPGLLDYTAFRKHFNEPMSEIGFNLAVLFTNLSDHMTERERDNVLEASNEFVAFFEDVLGRIEIKTEDKIERVYFGIDPGHMSQWRSPQISKSKRDFFYEVITSNYGDQMRLAAFVDFCEDAIFEMQIANSISSNPTKMFSLKFVGSKLSNIYTRLIEPALNSFKRLDRERIESAIMNTLFTLPHATGCKLLQLPSFLIKLQDTNMSFEHKNFIKLNRIRDFFKFDLGSIASLDNLWHILARNFFNLKLVSLAVSFVINLCLLSFKVYVSENEESHILSLSLSSWPLLSLLLRILSLLHTLLSFCLLISYCHLKIPLVVFKKEKQIARSLEFDQLYISEQPDSLMDKWNSIGLRSSSFPALYWDKFVKKRVYKQCVEDVDKQTLIDVLGINDNDNNDDNENKEDKEEGSKYDLSYLVWKAGVTMLDKSFVYLLVYLVFSLLGSCSSYFFFAPHLLDVAFGVAALRIILQAITHNGKQLVLTMMLLTIVVYIYTVIAFNFFGKFYGDDDVEDDQPENAPKCHDMLTCFVFHLYKGVRAGGGIGDEIEPPDGDEYEVWRILFDISFFFFIIVILLAIIQGFIIDAFGALRDEMQEVEDELETKCFICGLTKDYLDAVPHGFETHVSKEHNLANYLFFLMYLVNKDDTEFTGQETYVWDRYRKRCFHFFPSGQCFRKQCEDELN